MKKHSRSILAAALSVILLLSSAITSFADEALFVGETIGDASEITESSILFEDVQEISDLNEITEVEEVVAIEEKSALSDPDSEVLSAKLLMEGQTDPSDVFKDMKEYFADLGCTNTKINAKTGLYTDIGSFWNMLAMKALGIPGNTGTDYNKVDYTTLNAQVLSKFIIAMVNDGKDPHEYGVKDSDGNLTMNVIELLQSYYNSEDGGYGKPNAKGVKAGSIYNQPYIMYALAITDAEIGEKAGQFFESKANEDGIFNSYGLDMDTTSWAIQACELAGLEYPNKDKALAYMAEHVSDMNANTRGCYLNCLATLGMLKEEHITSLVNDAKIYNPSTKRFLYNGKDNASATQQAAIPVGEFYNGSMYRAYDDGYIAESELSTKKVYARIADAKGEKNTVDILKRTELSVASGASLVLDGVNTASSEVTLLDVFTEAVCAEKLGKDPSVADLEANKDYINEKLGAANTSYGLSLTKLYGYEDGSFGYYTDRETMAWSPVDPVTADGTEVFLFHYDYTAAAYAVFDKTEYEGTTASPAVVTVKKMDYDANWNPVFKGVAATVYAKNDKTEKAFTCAADGTVTLKGLEAGTYDLTAYFGDASAYIVSPYAVYKVTKADKPSPDNTGSGSGTVHETPDKTGKVGDPVTNGNWTRLSDGRWMYRTNALFRSTWGYIHNPYGSEGSQDAWFYFDRNGYMLTGWQHIVDTDGILRWYYLNPVSDGTLGACFLNGITPDGYTVNENGAWTVDGVVQEEKATPQQLAAASYDYSSDESAVTGSISISLTAGVTTTEGKRVSFSGSKKFSFADYEGSTAFDLLSELCGEKDWDIEGSGSYVSAINGLSEFDAGEQSGWMYSVNGKYPEIPAGDYVLKKGDKVVWRYVTSWVNTGM